MRSKQKSERNAISKRKVHVRTSALFAAGRISEMYSPVSWRIACHLCLECGVKPEAGAYCAECRAQFSAKVEDVGAPFDAWHWRVVQIRPGYDPPGFRLERGGIFEREGRYQVKGYADTLEA